MQKILQCDEYRFSKNVINVLLTLLFFTFVYENAVADGSPETTEVSPVRILVLGDSLSAAYKLPKEKGWVHIMTERFNNMGTPVQVVNASVSGITTAGGLQILPNALKQNEPQIVVIELGANDGLQGKPVPYITKNLTRLINLAQNDGAEVLLLGVRLPPNRGSRYAEPFFNQYSELSKQFDTALVPFFLEGVAGTTEFMMSDGLHPNAAGQPKVADNVMPALKILVAAKTSSHNK